MCHPPYEPASGPKAISYPSWVARRASKPLTTSIRRVMAVDTACSGISWMPQPAGDQAGGQVRDRRS